MKQYTLEEYLERLASQDPAPGGGAAAALTGAQASALLSMALKVSDLADDPKYQRALTALNASRGRLLTLGREDGESFLAVLEAYKLPKSTSAEKTKRTARVQAALQNACSVPLAIMAEIAQLYDHAEHLIHATKDTVVSDVGVAVLLMDSALRAANFNVKINLKYIKDAKFKDDAETRSQEILRGKKRRRKILLGEADSRISS